ncbi:MAG: molecular chaperone HtpG, partial [Clostridia bacterium]|nr:molecular chaperone HtpG [Clostridia bacterium]
AQSKYVKMFRDEGIDVILLDRVIDTQFINVIEQNKEGVKFCRIDAEIADVLKADGDKTELPAVADLFKTIAGEMTKVEFDRLKDASTPALLNISEESRRMNDMMKLYKYGGDLPMEQTLVLNTASPLVEKLTSLLDSGDTDRANVIAKQIYMLSSLTQRQLTADELVAFLSDSYDILGKL